MNRHKLLLWLSECTGDDIWSIQHCRIRGIPEDWILQLRDVYESGFQSQSEKIYFADQLVNHFEGVRDVDLACRIGVSLGVNVAKIAACSLTRWDCVAQIKESMEEDEF